MKSRSLTSQLVLSLVLAGGLALSSGTAMAQEAADSDRQKISDALSKGDAGAAEKLLQSLKKPATGNPAFEEIKACGFYPQETRLECAIDIKQTTGYGGGPLVGSFEYVLFCVDLPNFGLTPVGLVTLPMHDGSGNPPWQYAVYRDFPPSDRLRTTLAGGSVNTQTNIPAARARAILSWQAPPTDCNFVPVWGNVVNFRIRFDPIR